MTNKRVGDSGVGALGIIPEVVIPQSIGGFNLVNYGNLYDGLQANLVTAIERTPAADTFDLKLQHSHKPVYGPDLNKYDGVNDGGSPLLQLTGRDNAIGIEFTTIGICTIWKASVILSQVGAVAAGANVWCQIHAVNAGVPAALPLYGAVMGLSHLQAAADVAAVPTEYEFVFPWGQDLAAATTYWLVVIGDWAPSDANHLLVHYDTVLGTSPDFVLDNGGGPAWVATVNAHHWHMFKYLEYVDVPVAAIEGGAFTTITGNVPALNIVDEYQLREVDLTQCYDTIRMYMTLSGGTDWLPIILMTFGGAVRQPVIAAL